MSDYTRSGINLDTYFQTFSTGCLTAAPTNIRNRGTDLNARYAGRDNLAGNAVSAIPSARLTVGGVDIVSRFNRSGAIFNVAIGGTTTYNGSDQTPIISSFSPGNVVTPTITGSRINAGTYGPGSFTVGANIPTTYVKSLSGSYVIQARQPYQGGFQFIDARDNPNSGILYYIYYLPSNLVGGDSIQISLFSGDGWFQTGPDWVQNTQTTSSQGPNFFATGMGTIGFAVQPGGASATFTINSGGNGNYQSVNLTLTA